MSRKTEAGNPEPYRVPRASGDEPDEDEKFNRRIKCSPRERG